MQYRYDIVTRMLITRVELTTISIVTIRSIWQNSAAVFLRFGNFPPQIYEACGAAYRRNYEKFSAFKITPSHLAENRRSVQIDP